MYFSALKTAIQHLEEKRFYDVALMYLEQRGYQDLSIVDGAGDGGRDVVCSRGDLRIQLSVRKDWETKINDEALKTLEAGKRHLIFVTNRPIGPEAEQKFLDTQYKGKGHIDLTIADLRRVSTALSRPGVIRRSYEMLGMAVPLELHADPKDIAISTVLLFSQEARELRDEVIEANLRAQLLRRPDTSETELIQQVATAIPGENVDRAAKSALTRLRIAGRVQKAANGLRLSEGELLVMQAAETEFLAARKADVAALTEVTGLESEAAERLLDIALELLVRNRDLDGQGPLETSLSSLLAGHGLSRKRSAVYDALAATATARLRQYGVTVDQIFSTNSFDIYRALGRRTDLCMVLDASVAMPVLFGLAFVEAKSRYGLAATALKRACDAHGIKMVVPRVYLNEMAAHGQGALERLEIYNSLPVEARETLRASENAYISHYTHIAETLRQKGDKLDLKQFLGYFGISPGKSLNSIENRIESILDQQNIKIIADGAYHQDIRNRIQEKRLYHPKRLIDHDAIVVTMLKDMDQKGFVLATWDKVIIDLVEELARVYADTPARVIDFLSMATGEDFECEQSYELMTTLLHIDERAAAPLAQKIDQIRSVEQAYKLDAFIREAREHKGKTWSLSPQDLMLFIDMTEQGGDREESASSSRNLAESE
ncbi:restriction endonuclease [Methylocapsa aurea]|uniref:restriction endonuclease n=1 Tax=Methylocapsa aurea TaxID=663610 RepID=UPI00055D1757|nr:restriction endonuclease [Methylocapsa aurea]